MSNHHKGARVVRHRLAKGVRQVVLGLRLTGIAEAEAIGGTAKGQEATVRLYGADEALEELADVLLDGELLRSGEELYDEIEETLREAGDEALPGCARVLSRVGMGMVWNMAVGGSLGGVLRCDGHMRRECGRKARGEGRMKGE